MKLIGLKIAMILSTSVSEVVAFLVTLTVYITLLHGTDENMQDTQFSGSNQSVKCDRNAIDEHGNFHIQTYPRDLVCNTYIQLYCEVLENEVYGPSGLHMENVNPGSLDISEFYFLLEDLVQNEMSTSCKMPENEGDNCTSLSIKFPICQEVLNGTSFDVCARRTRNGLRDVCYYNTIQITFQHKRNVTCSQVNAPQYGFLGNVTSTTLLFGCNEGYSPQWTMTAVCVATDTWCPDPAQWKCTKSTTSNAGHMVTAATVVTTLIVLVNFIVA